MALGQAGFRLEADGTVLYIDPYLTDSVAEQFGEALRRVRQAPVRPHQIRDANVVLVTHAHLDHADPATLAPLSQASPTAIFLCPRCVVPILAGSGVSRDRIRVATEDDPFQFARVSVHTVPAAHTAIQRDSDGALECVGFVVRSGQKTVYHSGDTIPDSQIVRAVRAISSIDFAMLPVNERNVYRDRAGIIGNMTVREAFEFAAELGVSTLIPMHWDLFRPNSVYREEIELLFGLLKPPFEMTVLEPGDQLDVTDEA